MAGHPTATKASKSIGLRLGKLCKEKYKNKSECARALGMAPQNWTRVEAGRVRFDQDEIFHLAAFFGVDPGWLLTGRDAVATITTAPPAEIPFPAGAKPAANLKARPVRGLAAADDSGGSRAPNTDDEDDPYRFPERLMLVPVMGDSMSPVVLPGQYVAIDADREGFEGDDGIYVVSVLEPEPQDERREPIVGTFVKRCEKHEDMLYLKSINTYSPFSVYLEHCRIWPVLGVWFDGKGVPPEGF